MTTNITDTKITAELDPEDMQKALANHVLRTLGITRANVSAVHILTVRPATEGGHPTVNVRIEATNVERSR